MRVCNYDGLTAFDLISDYDEWIESSCFTGDNLSRLKGIRPYLYRNSLICSPLKI